MENFSTYFKALQACHLPEVMEHSLRPEIRSLLAGVAHDIDEKITILLKKYKQHRELLISDGSY